jgi:hypothetical protein
MSTKAQCMNRWIGTINFNSPTTYNASTIIGVYDYTCQTLIHSYQCTTCGHSLYGNGNIIG